MFESREVRLRIEKLVAGGDGLGFEDGKAVFVPFSLPGETILARTLPGKRDFSRAELIQVLEPSPRRIVPPCPVYGECGGCNLQHLEYSGQLEAKSRIVAEAFSRTARIEAEAPPCAPSEPFGYRNRMQLHFTRDKRVGLMRRSSSEAIAVDSCPVAELAIRSWLEAHAQSRIAHSSIADSSAAYAELSSKLGGADRFLVFGYGDELWIEGKQDVVEVEVAGPRHPLSRKGLLSEQSRAFGAPRGRGYGRTLGRSRGRSVLWRRSLRLLPRPLLRAPRLRRAERSCPRAGQVERLRNQARVLRRLDGRLGPLGLGQAGFRPRPRGPAAHGARAPRSAPGFPRSRPATIVYVSCDPVTLARDSGELVRSGYALRELKAFDFYPQTSHVECYARFGLR